MEGFVSSKNCRDFFKNGFLQGFRGFAMGTYLGALSIRAGMSVFWDVVWWKHGLPATKSLRIVWGLLG